jgi:hypothetical protein
VTWNPADKSANITLSNGNLTATNGGSGDNLVRSIVSASSGKKYCEITADIKVNNGTDLGVGTGAEALTNWVGATADSVGWIGGDGNIWLNSNPITGVATWTQGDTLCIAFDIDNMRIWFRTNGGNWNNSGTANPATNTEGIDVSALNAGPFFVMVSFRTNADQFTANFGGTAYAHAPPSGFGNW